MLQILSLALVLAGPSQASSPALHVVVIEGEDAVNIIQQKTAVRPVVEVRDRNNLPVPGALVTFSIEGGKAATFGGASTLTVATNAAGQAAVSGLTPSAAGAFQIQVSAAFQGQVATATIAQTNVLTAAQAAAAGASSASGAGGGGAGAGGGAGGGLSATTIGVVGAAVAGGAVAATQVAKQDDDGGGNVYAGTISGPIVSVIVGRDSGNTCTINRSVNGTARLTLDSNTSTSVSGHLDLTGTDAVVSQTCVVTDTSTTFGGTMSIAGSPSAMRGSDSHSETAPGRNGETIQGTTTVVFEGALSGKTVSGTLKYEQKSVSTGGGGGPVDQSASGTFTVTLTKS